MPALNVHKSKSMGSFQAENANATHSRSSKDLENVAMDEFVQNVIYAFTGIPGKYFKKDVIVGGLKLDPKIRLNSNSSNTLLRLCEVAYFHDQVESFTDASTGRSPIGLLGQGLVTSFKHELTLYYGMVAMLQEQVSNTFFYLFLFIIRNGLNENIYVFS